MLELESIGEVRTVKQFCVKLTGHAELVWILEDDLIGLINGQLRLSDTTFTVVNGNPNATPTLEECSTEISSGMEVLRMVCDAASTVKQYTGSGLDFFQDTNNAGRLGAPGSSSSAGLMTSSTVQTHPPEVRILEMDGKG